MYVTTQIRGDKYNKIKQDLKAVLFSFCETTQVMSHRINYGNQDSVGYLVCGLRPMLHGAVYDQIDFTTR